MNPSPTSPTPYSSSEAVEHPESALSLPGCLALIGLLRDLVNGGSQVLLSTHLPVLAAYPNADLFEIGEWGIRISEYDDLELVRNWRAFLDVPERFLRHITWAVPCKVMALRPLWGVVVELESDRAREGVPGGERSLLGRRQIVTRDGDWLGSASEGVPDDGLVVLGDQSIPTVGSCWGPRSRS